MRTTWLDSAVAVGATDSYFVLTAILFVLRPVGLHAHIQAWVPSPDRAHVSTSEQWGLEATLTPLPVISFFDSDPSTSACGGGSARTGTSGCTTDHLRPAWGSIPALSAAYLTPHAARRCAVPACMHAHF